MSITNLIIKKQDRQHVYPLPKAAIKDQWKLARKAMWITKFSGKSTTRRKIAKEKVVRLVRHGSLAPIHLCQAATVAILSSLATLVRNCFIHKTCMLNALEHLSRREWIDRVVAMNSKNMEAYKKNFLQNQVLGLPTAQIFPWKGAFWRISNPLMIWEYFLFKIRRVSTFGTYGWMKKVNYRGATKN